MWKPGQIVTVKGIICRVVKDNKFPSCWNCTFLHLVRSYEFPCSKCLDIHGNFKLPDDCHLEKICLKKAKL